MRKFIGIVLMVFGLFIYLFFRKYNGGFIPYPTLWFFIGLVIAFVGYRLFRKSKTELGGIMNRSIVETVNELKKNGRRLNVDLGKCEIFTSNYFEELPKSNFYKIQSLDMMYDSSSAVGISEKNQSRIVYAEEGSANAIKYVSPLIQKDKVTLSFIMEAKGHTTIYVDKNNKDIYYFDLSFLES